jgi:hypothetical protein
VTLFIFIYFAEKYGKKWKKSKKYWALCSLTNLGQFLDHKKWYQKLMEDMAACMPKLREEVSLLLSMRGIGFKRGRGCQPKSQCRGN